MMSRAVCLRKRTAGRTEIHPTLGALGWSGHIGQSAAAPAGEVSILIVFQERFDVEKIPRQKRP